METKRSQDEGKADFPSEGEAVMLSRPSAASSLGTVPDKAALPRAWVSHILRALRTLADYLQRRTLCTFSGCNRGKHGGFAPLNRRSEEPRVCRAVETDLPFSFRAQMSPPPPPGAFPLYYVSLLRSGKQTSSVRTRRVTGK